MVAMFSTGPSSIEIPVSYDKRLLEEAISRVGGHGMSYRDIMDSLDGAQGPQGLRYNAHVAFKTAFELIGNLERMGNRRKVLLLVSNGYDFDPFPGGRTGTDQVFGGRYGTPMGDPERGDRFLQLEERHNVFADSDLAAEMAAVTGAANRVNAAVYTLDPRGVVGTTNLEQNVDIGELRTHIGKTQSSLKVLADATGGFAVINDNRYDGALARIDAETSDYYILGYSPSNTDPEAPQPAGRGQGHPRPGWRWRRGAGIGRATAARRRPSPESSRSGSRALDCRPDAARPRPLPRRQRVAMVADAGDAVADGRGGVGPKRR